MTKYEKEEDTSIRNVFITSLIVSKYYLRHIYNLFMLCYIRYIIKYII